MDVMKKLSIVGILSLLAFGCGDDDDRDTRPMLMDSGTIMLPDSGTTEMDSGTTTPEECRAQPQPLPAAALPRCAAETLTCYMNAATNEARQACLNDDPTPPLEGQISCNLCTILQLVACGAANGCDAQWGDFNCCAEACDTQACVDACDLDPFIACLNGTGTACQGAFLSCFPS
ncbi:MAG: hypothetical protein KF901_00720 [Myxococcales bacterium]|nr:hypothetical protein [Myxococcales bacterium]